MMAREPDAFGLLTKVVFAIGFVVVGIAGGGLAIYVQIGDLKATAAATARDVAALGERIAKIEKSASDLVGSQNQVLVLLNRIDSRLTAAPVDQGPTGPIALSPFEEQIIRDFLQLQGSAKGPPQYAIGQSMTGFELKPIPDDVAAKIPKLRGARYAYDPNNHLIIVGAGNLVVAIVSPTT